MLTGNILNSTATLNNFTLITTKTFIPGDQFKLVIQLFDSELDLRYIPPSTTLHTFVFNNVDGSTLTKVDADMTVFADDRSLISINISAVESMTLQGGNFTFFLDLLGDGTQISKGIVQLGLSRLIDGGDCGC